MSDISKSKTLNSKVALRAGVWYVVSSVLVRMVSVITTPIFTRMLSTDEYGVVSTFSAWYSLFLVIYSLNLTVSIGRAKLDYPDKLDEYIGSMQLLSLLVSIAISIFIIIFIKPLSVFFDLSVPATFLLVIYLIATPSINFFQSGYRYKYLYKQNIAEISEQHPFNKSAMVWRLMRIIPTLLHLPAFSRLNDYLGSAPEQNKLFHLAEKIADLFDQYLVYRPEWINQWQTADWQQMTTSFVQQLSPRFKPIADNIMNDIVKGL